MRAERIQRLIPGFVRNIYAPRIIADGIAWGAGRRGLALRWHVVRRWHGCAAGIGRDRWVNFEQAGVL
jgi:hypothetical protein